jgi:protein MpaA
VLLVPVAAACGAGAAPTTTTIAYSVGKRPIVAFRDGDRDATTRVLIVGCIHGNEPAGIAIAVQLERLRPSAGIELWIVPDLNPDGVAAHTRQNARGVDLNRNFPFRWRRLGGVFESGPFPLSEPESSAAYRLILRVRPSISIWFHQHLSLVDESEGDRSLERRYARLVGLPTRTLKRYPGSAVGWENHRFPRATAFVVELPAGRLSEAAARRYARAVTAIAGTAR